MATGAHASYKAQAEMEQQMIQAGGLTAKIAVRFNLANRAFHFRIPPETGRDAGAGVGVPSGVFSFIFSRIGIITRSALCWGWWSFKCMYRHHALRKTFFLPGPWQTGHTSRRTLANHAPRGRRGRIPFFKLYVVLGSRIENLRGSIRGFACRRAFFFF